MILGLTMDLTGIATDASLLIGFDVEFSQNSAPFVMKFFNDRRFIMHSVQKWQLLSIISSRLGQNAITRLFGESNTYCAECTRKMFQNSGLSSIGDGVPIGSLFEERNGYYHLFLPQ
jgi:hypothetical protein